MMTSVISMEYVDILKKMEGEKLPENIPSYKDYYKGPVDLSTISKSKRFNRI